MNNIIKDEAILVLMKEKVMVDFQEKLTQEMTKVANQKVELFVKETCEELAARIEVSKDPIAFMTTVSLTLNLPNWIIRHETQGA